MLILTDSTIFRYCSLLLTPYPRFTLSYLSLPSITDKAALLTVLNRNRFRAGEDSGQTTSCYNIHRVATIYSSPFISVPSLP